jgi:hypothetical protein
MALTKGQRIEIRAKGATQLGHVHRISAAGVALIMDSWMVTKPVDAARVEPSTAPVPEGTPGHRKWAKGDRVEFEHDARTVHATVVSADLEIVKSIADGGAYEHVTKARDLRPSTKVLPKPAPSVMDDWGVRSYREAPARSRETDAFEATVTYKGKPVLKAGNDGKGGPNRYDGDRETVDRLVRDGQTWLAEAGVEHVVEGADQWLDWHARLRPYAVDAREHLRETDELIGQKIYQPFDM